MQKTETIKKVKSILTFIEWCRNARHQGKPWTLCDEVHQSQKAWLQARLRSAANREQKIHILHQQCQGEHHTPLLNRGPGVNFDTSEL